MGGCSGRPRTADGDDKPEDLLSCGFTEQELHQTNRENEVEESFLGATTLSPNDSNDQLQQRENNHRLDREPQSTELSACGKKQKDLDEEEQHGGQPLHQTGESSRVETNGQVQHVERVKATGLAKEIERGHDEGDGGVKGSNVTVSKLPDGVADTQRFFVTELSHPLQEDVAVSDELTSSTTGDFEQEAALKGNANLACTYGSTAMANVAPKCVLLVSELEGSRDGHRGLQASHRVSTNNAEEPQDIMKSETCCMKEPTSPDIDEVLEKLATEFERQETLSSSKS